MMYTWFETMRAFEMTCSTSRDSQGPDHQHPAWARMLFFHHSTVVRMCWCIMCVCCFIVRGLNSSCLLP